MGPNTKNIFAFSLFSFSVSVVKNLGPKSQKILGSRSKNIGPWSRSQKIFGPPLVSETPDIDGDQGTKKTLL